MRFKRRIFQNTENLIMWIDGKKIANQILRIRNTLTYQRLKRIAVKKLQLIKKKGGDLAIQKSHNCKLQIPCSNSRYTGNFWSGSSRDSHVPVWNSVHVGVLNAPSEIKNAVFAQTIYPWQLEHRSSYIHIAEKMLILSVRKSPR